MNIFIEIAATGSAFASVASIVTSLSKEMFDVNDRMVEDVAPDKKPKYRFRLPADNRTRVLIEWLFPVAILMYGISAIVLVVAATPSFLDIEISPSLDVQPKSWIESSDQWIRGIITVIHIFESLLFGWVLLIAWLCTRARYKALLHP